MNYYYYKNLLRKIIIRCFTFILLMTCIKTILFFESCAVKKELQQYIFHGSTMGTTYQVKITQVLLDEEHVKIIKNKIDSALVRINHRMSTYDPNSEITRFNDFRDTAPFEVSSQFVEVVTAALNIYKDSQHAFDITVGPLVNLWGFGNEGSRADLPSDLEIENILKIVGSDKIVVVDRTHLKKNIPDLEIDLNAIAKGYGVDIVASLLNSIEYNNYMVEIGGEVVTQGKNASNQLWKIGIDIPEYAILPGREFQAKLAISNVAVATSGDYRNYFKLNGKTYSHTINPKTGRPVTHNLASVTIIASTCMQADGIATAAMVLGEKESLKWIEGIPDVEVLLIVRNEDDSFSEYQSSGFGKHLAKK